MLKPPPVLSMPVSGIETLLDAVAQADLEVTQFRPGQVTGSLLQAPLGGTVLSVGDITGPVRLRGVLSETEPTFGILLHADEPSFQWSIEGRNGDVCVFPAGHTQEAIAGNQHHYAALRLSEEMIASLKSLLPPEEVESTLNSARHFRPPKPHARRLAQLMQSVADKARRNDQAFHHVASKREIQRTIVATFWDAISAGEQPGPSGRTSGNAFSLVRRAEDYIRANMDHPIQTPDLCRELGVSGRSLYRAFATAVGMPPGHYLRHWRLSRTRQMLACAAPGEVTVTQVACECGFWELGRFAQRYRQLFGERPSETLARI